MVWLHQLAFHTDKKLQHTSGVHALGGDLAKDRVFTAQDRFVLVVHDGAGAHRCILSEISRKSRDGWDHNDHPELSSFLPSPDNGINNGTSDGVEDRCLLVSSRSDLMGLAAV